jgi:hypothetical protein
MVRIIGFAVVRGIGEGWRFGGRVIPLTWVIENGEWGMDDMRVGLETVVIFASREEPWRAEWCGTLGPALNARYRAICLYGRTRRAERR